MRRTGDRSQATARRPLIWRIAGWLGADGNPLRRGIDRFELALRMALAIGFLVAAPLLVPVVGRITDVAGMKEVGQESSWRQVNAVLLRPAPPRYYGYGSMATYWVPARWRAPSGQLRRGMIPTRTGAPAGSVIGIWVNWSGHPTGRHPMTAALVRVRSVLLQSLAVVCLGALAMASAGLARWLLNRRRLAAWGMEWACFGPRWTARRWPRN